MFETEPISSVLLGTGRSQPGLWGLHPGDTTPTLITHLKPGQSVYTIDAELDADLIVLGTRSGSIEVFSMWEASTGPGQQYRASLPQNAPLLAVCFAGKDRVVGADVAGRCLLWNLLDGSNGATPLEVKGSAVCSVLSLAQDSIVGLSTDGKVLHWDMPTGTLSRVADAHRPCKKHSLVRLLHWAARNAIVYPADGGSLAVHELDTHQTKLLPAHAGEFYVIMTAGDRLYTIGRNDGLLKVWIPADTVPSQQISAPKGVATGQLLPDQHGRMLLVNDEGHAGVYEIQAGSLRMLRQLSGDSYRSVYCASQEARSAFEQRKRHARRAQLQDQIQAKIDDGDYEGNEELYQQLVGLGFEAVALALRARQAAQKHDDLGELRAVHALVAGLPSEDTTRTSWLRRYAQVLESLWCLEEAHAAQREAGVEQAVSCWLDEAAKIIAGDNWIAEPGISLSALITAATIIGKPFRGRWLFGPSEQLRFRGSELTGEVLAAKYERIRSGDRASETPHTTTETLCWICRESVRQVCVVLLERSSNAGTPGIRLGVQVRNDGHQSIAVPVVLLEAGCPANDISFGEHNRRVLSAHDEGARVGLDGLWPPEAHQTMTLALRRLRTEAIAKRLQ